MRSGPFFIFSTSLKGVKGLAFLFYFIGFILYWKVSKSKENVDELGRFYHF
jgi:hypothetical protein